MAIDALLNPSAVNKAIKDQYAIDPRASNTRYIILPGLAATTMLIIGRSTLFQAPQGLLKNKLPYPISLYWASCHQTLIIRRGMTPLPAAPASNLPGRSTIKKRCTSSGTAVSTFARSGRRSARTSTASSPTVNGAVFRGSSASSIGSSRRRNAPRCASRGGRYKTIIFCAMVQP